ncbi:1-phosphatidylinositol-5-phosphate 4-kinase [Schistosoma bovis]|uniref:1-phosphatidylinositol-5-phosphate 4-kinase n=1 Tax=Schistosoma bovis TaxID=6184 RepID=A0A430Q9M7_SCHBO|nr:1-phosphatidylinositol-5-phosphate 4-kinase [Schistosoma bovis]
MYPVLVPSLKVSKPLPTLKDADFLTDLCKMHIGEESKKKMLSTLECDIQFLQENNLIDYSLLIGVHNPEIALANSIEDAGDDGEGTGGELTPPDSPPGAECLPQLFSGELHPTLEHYGIKSSIDSPHPLIYFVAIIDILTRYGMRKRTAQTYKTVKHGADGGSVKPEFYGRRLLEFVEQCID